MFFLLNFKIFFFLILLKNLKLIYKLSYPNPHKKQQITLKPQLKNYKKNNSKTKKYILIHSHKKFKSNISKKLKHK